MPTPYTMKFIIMVWLAFFARRQAGFDDREAGLHEHDEEAGDERPHEVGRDHDSGRPTLTTSSNRQALLRVGHGDVGRRVPVIVPAGSPAALSSGFGRRRRP